MPMTAFATITKPNRASGRCPKTRTITSITDMIALNRVRRFERRMSTTERDPLASTLLTFPAATRSATWAAVSPRSLELIVTAPFPRLALPAVVIVVVSHCLSHHLYGVIVTVDLWNPHLILLPRHRLVREEVVLES